MLVPLFKRCCAKTDGEVDALVVQYMFIKVPDDEYGMIFAWKTCFRKMK